MYRVWYVTFDTIDGQTFERQYVAEDGRKALDKAAKDFDFGGNPYITGMGASLFPGEDWDRILQSGE